MKQKILFVIVVSIVCLFPVSLFGYDLVGKCVEGDCINGKGKFIFNDGREYKGMWKDSQRHGYGVYKSEGTIFLLGYWKDDFYAGEDRYSVRW